MRLNDGRCSGGEFEPVVNAAGTKFFFPFDNCNTEVRQAGGFLTYTNYVELHPVDSVDGIWTRVQIIIGK